MKAPRPLASGFGTSTPKPCFVRQSTEGRRAMRKDFADAFAAEGGAAKESLEGLKDQAVDALDLAISEAEEGSTAQKDNLKTYKFAKEQILPLLLRLEDEGERVAALKDVARRLKLTMKPLRKALSASEESQQEEAEQEGPARTEEP